MKRMPKTYKQSTVNAVVLILVLILLLYLGSQLWGSASAAVSTQRTQIITDTDYLHLKGYVFRHESAIEGPTNGIYDYSAEDGSKVGANKSYAGFYPTGDAASKQKKLDSLSEQIARLDSTIALGGTVSQLANIKRTMSSSYYAFINNVQNGNFSAADSVGDEFLDALVNYNTLAEGQTDMGSAAKAQLLNEKNALLSSCGTPQMLIADESFYFFREVDGYESVFDPQKLENITFDDMQKLLASRPQPVDNNVIGKRVNSAEWFLVLPTDAETVMRFEIKKVQTDEETETDGESDTDNETARSDIDEEETKTEFQIGKSFSVTFSSMGDKKSEMVLETAYIDESGNGYLIFSGYDMTLASKLSRAQDVKIDMGSKTGYRIPADALTEVKGETGVYILTGTVVEFRRVTQKVKDTGNGYCIVNTFAEDRAELEEAEAKGETVDKPPYLNENDLIITSGNDLYDGKLID